MDIKVLYRELSSFVPDGEVEYEAPSSITPFHEFIFVRGEKVGAKVLITPKMLSRMDEGIIAAIKRQVDSYLGEAEDDN